MQERVGRYVCLLMDTEGKLDLTRDENSKITPMFDSIEEAEKEMKDKGIINYNVCKIEVDTFYNSVPSRSGKS